MHTGLAKRYVSATDTSNVSNANLPLPGSKYAPVAPNTVLIKHDAYCICSWRVVGYFCGELVGLEFYGLSGGLMHWEDLCSHESGSGCLVQIFVLFEKK